MPIVNSMLGVTEQVPVPEGQPASAAVYHSRIFGAGVNAKDCDPKLELSYFSKFELSFL